MDPGASRHPACRGSAPLSSGAQVRSPDIEAARVSDAVIETERSIILCFDRVRVAGNFV